MNQWVNTLLVGWLTAARSIVGLLSQPNVRYIFEQITGKVSHWGSLPRTLSPSQVVTEGHAVVSCTQSSCIPNRSLSWIHVLRFLCQVSHCLFPAFRVSNNVEFVYFLLSSLSVSQCNLIPIKINLCRSGKSIHFPETNLLVYSE